MVLCPLIYCVCFQSALVIIMLSKKCKIINILPKKRGMSPSINANKQRQQQKIIEIGAAATANIDSRFSYVIQFDVNKKQVSKKRKTILKIYL